MHFPHVLLKTIKRSVNSRNLRKMCQLISLSVYQTKIAPIESSWLNVSLSPPVLLHLPIFPGKRAKIASSWFYCVMRERTTEVSFLGSDIQASGCKGDMNPFEAKSFLCKLMFFYCFISFISFRNLFFLSLIRGIVPF